MKFESLIQDIDKEYKRLQHTLSWRFLTSPKSTLSPTTNSVFLTLNPGGDKLTHEKDKESCENGSPYLHESWKNFAPGQELLQKQIQMLFSELDWTFDSVLSGQLVPFRSPSWAELPNQKASLRFGVALWKRVLEYVKPCLVVAMGKSELRTPLVDILGSPNGTETHSVGWGNISASLDMFENCKLLTLPHLSRFKLMGRPESRHPINKIISRTRNV